VSAVVIFVRLQGMLCICQAQRSKTLIEQKKRPQCVVA